MSSRSFRSALFPCFFILFVFILIAPRLQAQATKADAAKPVPKEAPKEAQHKEVQNPLEQFKTFSANVSGGIAHDHNRKILRSGNMIRLDFEDSYRVTDLSSLKMWGVSGERCMEFDRPDAGTFPFSAYQDYKIERFATQDKETVDGHVCKIENVTLTPDEDESPTVVKMKLWEAQDLDGFPVKIEVDAGPQKFTSTYTNVSLKAPEPKLFEHPAKCAVSAQPGQAGTAKSDDSAPKKDPPPPQPQR